MSLEDFLFSNRKMRVFFDRIREKDVNSAIRDLCLLGMEVFMDRNPTLTHYSYKQIQRCLANYAEESK